MPGSTQVQASNIIEMKECVTKSPQFRTIYECFQKGLRKLFCEMEAEK